MFKVLPFALHEAGVACSTAKALEWDEAWKNADEPTSTVYRLIEKLEEGR